MILGNRDLLRQLLGLRGSVNHHRIFCDCVGNLIGGFGENQFASGQTDGAIKYAPPTDHDHFIFHSLGIR